MHQLSVYDKMPIVNGFSKACFTFQFSLCPIEDPLKYKIKNRMHKFTHIKKYK
jgi:hypothetical protein